MINLIPNQEKKKKVKDFYFRLVVVFFVVMGGCMLIASIAIIPSYFLSSVKIGLENEKLEMQKKEPAHMAVESTFGAVGDWENKLKAIENAEKNKYLVSVKVINEIMMQKMADIKITQIFYENTSQGGKKISIRGIAPSRERLLLFRRALEDDSAFKKVDLPISNFIKGANIEFSLSLIPS